MTDRAELIERLKRGESPTWVPSRTFESMVQQQESVLRTPTRSLRQPSTSALLSPVAITPDKDRQDQERLEDRFVEGLSIERPRSALHSGDFTQEQNNIVNPDKRAVNRLEETELPYQTGGGTPWPATSPPRKFIPLDFARRQAAPVRTEAFKSPLSSLSSSLSQGWAYKPPTSPLVQSETNDELIDLALPLHTIDLSTSGSTSDIYRRHTVNFSPSTSRSYAGHCRVPSLRIEGTYPYQAHQPRRSLNSTPTFSLSGPSTPPESVGYPRSRRPSLSSDASPLLHASMVGSYEESILKGRMSTAPSKPLEFLAQIGVLGLGKCKPRLKCPPHVTLPFSAVFYSYPSNAPGRINTEDGPSPYVGQIDLENGLPDPDHESRAKRKVHSRYSDRRPTDDEDALGMEVEDNMADGADNVRRQPSRHKGSRSPRAPPGGSYRIPEQGQLQIIIKNQNKTAVKLFLVPYDLAGMEPGTKTFIRQRLYSTGAIIDGVPGAKEEVGSLPRPILRYLVHLHICCPAKGRFFLYKNMRVVFANRVPDGKEKLRNEVTYPEPRFSPYKPIRVMHPPAPSGPAASLAMDKAYRRRSSGYQFAGHNNRLQLDALDGLGAAKDRETAPTFTFPSSGSGNNLPVEAVPFSVLRSRALSDAASTTSTEAVVQSPNINIGSEGFQSPGPEEQLTRFHKLSRGDARYGENLFMGTSSEPRLGAAEGLLSMKLRS